MTIETRLMRGDDPKGIARAMKCELDLVMEIREDLIETGQMDPEPKKKRRGRPAKPPEPATDDGVI